MHNTLNFRRKEREREEKRERKREREIKTEWIGLFMICEYAEFV